MKAFTLVLLCMCYVPGSSSFSDGCIQDLCWKYLMYLLVLGMERENSSFLQTELSVSECRWMFIFTELKAP